MSPTSSRSIGLVVGVTLLVVAAVLPPGALAQLQSCEPQVARLTSVQGTVEAQRAGTTPWRPAKQNDGFCPGDQIRVRERSRADLQMLDQSVLRLNANTTLTVEAVKDESTGVVDLLRGAAHFFSRGARSLEVKTPFTIAGVRGTEFYVSVEPDRTLLTVFEGQVLAESPAGSLALASGQFAVAEAGKAPVLRVVARPRDAVHWALYYPPVLYFRPDEFPAGPDWRGSIRQSLEAYLAGDLQRAFDAIATVPETVPDPRFFTYRAHLLLAVGRVDEANADLGQALRLAPNDPNALAIQTIIAVAQGEKDRALDSAQKAVQAAPGSATALVALSYAQQARFDLEGARANLEKAVAAEPENALAWARLAELHASFGHLGKALDAAQKAVALQPNLARTQTVLGYAYLTQVKIGQAKEAFAKAMALDQSDPLPRLGLGLARIRESGLAEGSREIEVAASLDPSNAIVRSYLGKAYYEEKRTGLDEREYHVAKELDPRDPTPWFYDAIQKQTTNRPVEALLDLQKAIELNDNRAVYRSQLLLDSDLAARSASLARIYSDLGFQQLALVEGWKSVNTDPTNFSAHRFLADSYSVLPRHEIARVSELLQAQLLQPTNITPIQPSLAESDLFLISSGGPGTLSFNEFNPIFNRNRIAAQLSGLVGENGTWAEEVVVSGIYRNFSFSVGQSRYETDGFRANFDQKDDIVNVFAQYEFSHRTSVQAEYRYRKTERGDTQLRFFPDDFSPTARNELERTTVRLSARHAFTPSSILLGSFVYQDLDEVFRDDQFPSFCCGITSLTERFPEEALGGELQHLFRSRYLDLTSGIGFFDIDSTLDETFEGESESFDTSLEHLNLYAYATIKPHKSVAVTLGASYDRMSGESLKVPDGGETDQFNPKVGVMWSPFAGTTIRAAAFRMLKRPLVTDQTLEPVQVAGFNQFFDDFDAVDAWRYGVGIDQKFTRRLFGGLELSKRDLDQPVIEFSEEGTPVTTSVDAKEYLARAYLNWAPHPMLAFSGDYLFERFEKSEGFGPTPIKLDTHRVPLSVRFFHPSGLSASVTATYVNQDGEFLPQGSESVRTGSDDFWIVNATVGYRLPRRYGFLVVGATNLFDEEFRYFEVDRNNPTLVPDRSVFVRLTLAFP